MASRTRTSSGCWSRTTASTGSPSRSSGRSPGLRVGPFYGCYVVRPKPRLGYDEHPDRDIYLEKVIATLGGEVVAYDGARKCCGFPVITMNKETSLRQAGTHVGDALDAGADCLVTPCPLCHLNLDMQQPEAAKIVNRDLGLAVLHLPQLVGLALGAEPRAARHGASHRLHRLGRVPARGRGPGVTVPRELYERISAIERAIGNLYDHLGLEHPGLPGDGEVSDEVRALAAAGEKTEAMQLYRRETGADLYEAQRSIEEISG